MPLIEGLGDEVTLVLATLLVCVMVTLAWISTHTADLPALREVGITVIERTQIRRRVAAQPARPTRPADNQNLAGLMEFVSTTSESTSDEVEESSSGARSSHDTEVSEGQNVTVIPRTSPSIEPSNVLSSSTFDSGFSREEPVQDNLNSEQQQEADDTKSSEHHHQNERQVKESTDVDLQHTNRPDISLRDSENAIGEEVRRRRVEFFQSSHSLSRTPTDGNSSTASCSVDNDAAQCETANSPVTAPSNQHLEETDSRPSDTQPTSSEPAQPSVSRTSPGGSDNIRVRLKYMNETQRLVYTSPLDTIGNFRRTHFQQELQEGDKWVRFIFNGQDLRDDEATLQAYQVGDNCTMHCLITNKRRTPTVQTGSGGGGGLHGADDGDNDSVLGTLMYPLFTLVLSVVWYFRLTYRQYFSPMSTVCLIGTSFLLGLGYFSSLRTATGRTGNQPEQRATSPGDQTEARSNRQHSL